MNISAKDFLLNEERISQIIDCLDQSPLPLREIALLTGSRSEYYLNAVFKKYRGIPPGESRRKKTQVKVTQKNPGTISYDSGILSIFRKRIKKYPVGSRDNSVLLLTGWE